MLSMNQVSLYHNYASLADLGTGNRSEVTIVSHRWVTLPLPPPDSRLAKKDLKITKTFSRVFSVR